MVFGMFMFGTGYGQAAPDDATFRGNVTVSANPAPDTLVMYSVGSQEAPAGNSTVSDIAGDYEIWVEGGYTYYLYFANGGAMFDLNAQILSSISPGETKYVNPSLTPAPARTVTLKGYLTNASNASQPVTVGHLLGMRMSMGGDPDYINWTVPNATGYYELMVLPGSVMAAVFDAPGYFPTMGPMSPLVTSPGDTAWINMSLRPFTGYNVNITGYVMHSMVPLAIQGATVRTYTDGPGFSMSNVTDATGYYKVQTIEGSGGMEVEAASYVSQRLGSMYFIGNMSQDFYLNPLNAGIHGYVLDADSGEPIPNATVYADSWVSGDLYQFNQTTSGPDGYYSLGLCGSNWWVAGQANGYGQQGENVNLLAGEDILHNITLVAESGTIRGIVTDWVTGLPIASATVRINGESTWQDNATITNASGYYEINCLPDNYEMTFIASGYMWEVSQGYSVVVGPDETVWINHSLDPATVQIFGTVTDALTHGPIDGAEITVASLSPHYPGYFRVAMSTSSAGNYSMMVAFDEGWSMVMAEHPAYETYQDLVSIPDVVWVECNISMLPFGAIDTYTLQGYVNDSLTYLPIDMAYVEAMFGMSYGNSTFTNSTGFYSMELPIVELNVRASANGHLPSEVTSAPGSTGEVVWLNFTLDSHLEPPLLAGSVDPNASVSIHNHANVSVDIVEPYFNSASLNFMRVTERTEYYVWAEYLEGYYAGLMFGMLMGDLVGSEITPGHWWIGLPDWDTTSEDLIMLTDGTGAWEALDSYWWDAFRGIIGVYGNYVNGTMMFPMSADALFDSATGVFLGMDMGGGNPDPWTASDPTGSFWMSRNHIQFNLTDGTIMNSMDMDTAHLATLTMSLDTPSVTYPSSEYVALFSVVDVAQNRNYTFELFTVDNDAPVADAGAGQTEIVGLPVTLDASASTDNGQLVNYTWSIEDGATQTLWGAVVDYTFTTVGNHTVTVTVTDAAGYSDSASTWVDALADQVPVADAGPDQAVDEDTQVDFNGTGSHDDIGVTNYTWTVVGLTTVMYGVTPNTTFSEPGIYHVRLVVTDTADQTSTYDEVVITVVDVTPPVANAGPDQTVNVAAVATFDGTGSTDNAAITQYTWTFTDGILRTLTGVQPTYTFMTNGDYTVTLTVRDAEGYQDTDTMVVHVNDAPDANAGADQEVASGAEVTFDGSASTDDIEIENYTWSFTYDGTVHKMYGAAPKFTFDEPGTYEVQLTVTDVGGLTSTDSITVTVTGGGATSFVSDYWWALALVVIVVVAAAAFMLMRKGKGPSPKTGGERGEVPPPPPESEELEFPPPRDEEL
jgi:PKD repeat protein